MDRLGGPTAEPRVDLDLGAALGIMTALANKPVGTGTYVRLMAETGPASGRREILAGHCWWGEARRLYRSVGE